MPKTKQEALKQAKKFKTELPNMDVIVNKQIQFKKNTPFRYNYNFQKKTGKTNKIIWRTIKKIRK